MGLEDKGIEEETIEQLFEELPKLAKTSKEERERVLQLPHLLHDEKVRVAKAVLGLELFGLRQEQYDRHAHAVWCDSCRPGYMQVMNQLQSEGYGHPCLYP